MLLTLLPYILTAYKGALIANSFWLCLGYYAFVHFLCARPWGYGTVSDRDGDIYYTLAFVLYDMLATWMAVAHNVRGVANKMAIEETREHTIARYVKSLVFIGMTIAATLPFEYMHWYGVVISAVLLPIVDVVFFYIPFRPSSSMLNPWLYDISFANVASGDASLVKQIMIHMCIFDFITTITFGVPYVLAGTSFWQFWIALIIFGGFAIETAIITGVFLSRQPAVLKVLSV